MGYSVLQTSTKRVSERRLIAAYQSIESLTHLDAKRRAKGVAGYLAHDLSHEDAWALLEGLAAQGVPAGIVEDHEVPDLPQPVSCRGAHLYPDRLELMDSLNRLVPFLWEDLALVAGGRVTQTTTQRSAPFMQDTVITQYGALNVQTPDTRRTEVRRRKSIVELHLTNGDRRVFEDIQLVRLHGVDAQGCEDPPEQLAVAAASYAPQALLNQGVEVAVKFQRFAKYPTLNDLHREMRWLLWLTRS